LLPLHPQPTYTEAYFPVLLQAVIAMALAAGLLSVSYLLGKKVRNKVKDTPYESGIVPTGDARHRFSVKFYLVGMLFILFDIEAMRGGKYELGELSLEIAAAKIVSVCGFLKYDQQFVRLSSVTAVDWYPSEPRFEVVYHLHSIQRNLRVRLKCRLASENPE